MKNSLTAAKIKEAYDPLPKGALKTYQNLD